MALPKLYDLITWHNNTTPALNEDNLNAMSQAIDDIDDRLIGLAGTIMEDVPQIIEDMATVEAGLETVGQAVTDAQTAATAATADKLKSEGFAVGEQNGVPVDSSSPYYHNNAKYYSQVAPPTAAAHVSYDNSQSHLEATDVQGAVDELKEDLNGEVKTRAALGAHNLFNIYGENLYSYTMQINNDHSFTITAPNATTYRRNEWPINVKPNTDYVITSTIDYTSGVGRIIVKGADNSTQLADTSNITTDGAVTLSFNTGANSKIYIWTCATWSTSEVGSVTYNNFMLRLATDSDPTYQPYAMTNRELTASKVDWASNGVLGAKNIFNIENYTEVSNATIANNGFTNSATDGRTAFYANVWYLDSSKNPISSTYLGALSSNGRYVYDITVPNNTKYIKFGHSGSSKNCTVTVPFGASTGAWKIIFTVNGYNPSSVGGLDVRNVMLCVPSDTDTTYQPYAMTNKELTDFYEKVKNNFVLVGQNSVSVNSDGVKTYKTLLNEAFNAFITYLSNHTSEHLRVTKVNCINARYNIKDGADGAIYNGSTVPSYIEGFLASVNSSGLAVQVLAMNATLANNTLYSYTSSGGYTDLSEQVPATSKPVAIYFDIYKKI